MMMKVIPLFPHLILHIAAYYCRCPCVAVYIWVDSSEIHRFTLAFVMAVACSLAQWTPWGVQSDHSASDSHPMYVTFPGGPRIIETMNKSLGAPLAAGDQGTRHEI